MYSSSKLSLLFYSVIVVIIAMVAVGEGTAYIIIYRLTVVTLLTLVLYAVHVIV
jgi:hypothetical protein